MRSGTSSSLKQSTEWEKQKRGREDLDSFLATSGNKISGQGEILGIVLGLFVFLRQQWK